MRSAYLLLLLVAARPACAQDADSPLYVHAPSFSPGGEHILFYANLDERENFDVYTSDLDGSHITRLTDDAAYDGGPAFSPDGGTIAFGSRRNGPWQIFLMDADGGNERRLTDLQNAHDPVWSPDGSRIAFVRHVDDNQDIFTMDADGSNVRRLTDHPENDHSPSWSPDGSHIVFASSRSGAYGIHVMNVDGKDVENISASAPGDHQVKPAWSPDGSRILFSTVGGSAPGLHTMNPDGSAIRRVTSNHPRDPAAAWSPDGAMITYLLEDADGMAVYVVNADGTDPKRVTPADSPPASEPDARPNVAILVYDGVQIIDHAIPYEVFGQFSLNNVYTVAVDTEPLDTFMGMTIVPGYSFEDAPVPDVLVLPGGNAGDAQRNPQIRAWIERTAQQADHVLTLCTGIFFLEDHPLLAGRTITTWYDRQEELRAAVPSAHVVGDRTVVEDGKLVSAAGLGVDGALLVLDRLHGRAWAEVVRLNMEHERMPATEHVPRTSLADMKLPDALYGAFPWRASKLTEFSGDTDAWSMTWRIPAARAGEVSPEGILDAVEGDGRWTLKSSAWNGKVWTSRWSVGDDAGTDGNAWSGRVSLAPADAGKNLLTEVRRGGRY